MVADHFQPVQLFGGEGFFTLPSPLPSPWERERFLLRQPGFEVGVDPLGKWHQFVVLMRGEADEGDEVGEDALAARAFDLRLLQRGIGLPELGFVPEIGRLFDGVGQILDVLELQPLLVGLAVEDLQGGDLVLVLCDELLE